MDTLNAPLILNYKKIDLTHTMGSSIPLWPGSTPFKRNIKLDYDHGCRVLSYAFVAGTGTHIDAPAHFIKDALTIDQLSLDELIAPACIIDIRGKVEANADYALAPDDIFNLEKIQGKISEKSIVIACTGWSSRWPDTECYRNMDKSGTMHFPGFSVEAAKVLLERKIVGLGIDTFSPDPGIAKTFPIHCLLLPKGIYFLENLANLDLLPAVGAIIFALPIRIQEGTEAPARVIALVP